MVTPNSVPSTNLEKEKGASVNTSELPAAIASRPPNPKKRPPKPNYAKIHAKPLPLETYPLPAFIPQSPLSLLRIAAVLLKQLFAPPPSHPASPYVGYFSSESRSVHVTDPAHVRALWEMGFFGKGTLSRSEPSWLDREKARLKEGGAQGGTAEEATRKRREERKLFKLERARLEREQIEQQLKQESGLIDATKEAIDNSKEPSHNGGKGQMDLSHVFPWQSDSRVVDNLSNNKAELQQNRTTADVGSAEIEPKSSHEPAKEKFQPKKTHNQHEPVATHQEPEINANQEHLQLTLEEAFFLSYGLGVLDIRTSSSLALQPQPASTRDLFMLYRRHSFFPPAEASELRPDDPFLLNYVVYHHYRSLGWVVRPGVKFSVDYMLYNRGPVFSHAEFALMIIPEYAPGTREAQNEQKDWWWFHCINRVQSQVRKSLVVCYVEVPSSLPSQAVGQEDIGAILRQYKIREFVLRRWLSNRSRD